VWLKKWSDINGRYGGNPQVGKYIGVYFAFGVGSAALVVVQTLILWIFCSIEVSGRLSGPLLLRGLRAWRVDGD
jgi:ATP-binding cassette, subfamily C (CFTR/MRP), member 1